MLFLTDCRCSPRASVFSPLRVLGFPRASPLFWCNLGPKIPRASRSLENSVKIWAPWPRFETQNTATSTGAKLLEIAEIAEIAKTSEGRAFERGARDCRNDPHGGDEMAAARLPGRLSRRRRIGCGKSSGKGHGRRDRSLSAPASVYRNASALGKPAQFPPNARPQTKATPAEKNTDCKRYPRKPGML